jgi:hypothetical protein
MLVRKMTARLYEFEGIRLVLSKSGIVPLNRRYPSEARCSLWRRHAHSDLMRLFSALETKSRQEDIGPCELSNLA